ncbi:Alstrom syndrome 1 [Gossypium arboreum]|uniref:Alstrom syndrome 1 n=2 Tax=Gossypium arboreum TaxID=29729 RepID=A0A0B0MNJ5_GOSAR|nr:hypothetical protein PVK06_008882 [Gossypium arboreum]KHG03683.1 Alstrom syndrome 1 [Gossypium arboreum]KHG29873.1 Alstrom syndrome 1 [Gossypium arboreum]
MTTAFLSNIVLHTAANTPRQPSLVRSDAQQHESTCAPSVCTCIFQQQVFVRCSVTHHRESLYDCNSHDHHRTLAAAITYHRSMSITYQWPLSGTIEYQQALSITIVNNWKQSGPVEPCAPPADDSSRIFSIVSL